jgi:hypothetical protein
LHEQAQRVGSSSGVERCPCCHEKTDVTLFPLSVDQTTLGQLGSGISIQFKFNQAMQTMIFLVLIFSGIFNLRENQKFQN